MDTYEAKVLLEDSVRCLARMMDQIRLRETEKAMGCDEPMQDHLAECTWAQTPYEGTDFEDCLKYLKNLYKGFKTASDHEIKMGRTFNPGDIELGHICDMVWGFIGHSFPEKLVMCAREIDQVAKKLLKAKGHYIKSDNMCNQVVTDFLKDACDIIEKHGFKDWEDGEYSIQMGYLEAWMKRQYWEK